jgi:hypothetical protein
MIMVDRIRRPNKGKEKTGKVDTKAITEKIDHLKAEVDKDLSQLMFNVDLREKKVSAYIIGILYEDGWIHMIRPDPVVGLRMVKIMSDRLKEDITGA